MRNKVLSFLILSTAFAIPLAMHAQVRIDNPLGSANMIDLLNRIVDFIFLISIPFVTVMILVAGYYFISSLGDPEKILKAKR